MGQLITTIISILVLLCVPAGILQVHTVMQMKSELVDLSYAAAKFVSNHGGMSDTDVLRNVRSFVQTELDGKAYKLADSDITVEIVRTKGADPTLWSHADEFRLSLEMPYPKVINLFAGFEKPLRIERLGTINTMDYDLVGGQAYGY
jgi:hypothetical protein